MFVSLVCVWFLARVTRFPALVNLGEISRAPQCQPLRVFPHLPKVAFYSPCFLTAEVSHAHVISFIFLQKQIFLSFIFFKVYNVAGDLWSFQFFCLTLNTSTLPALRCIINFFLLPLWYFDPELLILFLSWAIFKIRNNKVYIKVFIG